MTVQTISIADDQLVVLSRNDFEELMEKAGMLPPRPLRDANGNVPARAAIDVSIARDLVSDRIRHGWTQTELARRSGVRLETISRIESGKHIPRQETLIKLDRALSGKKAKSTRVGIDRELLARVDAFVERQKLKRPEMGPKAS